MNGSTLLEGLYDAFSESIDKVRDDSFTSLVRNDTSSIILSSDAGVFRRGKALESAAIPSTRTGSTCSPLVKLLKLISYSDPDAIVLDTTMLASHRKNSLPRIDDLALDNRNLAVNSSALRPTGKTRDMINLEMSMDNNGVSGS